MRGDRARHEHDRARSDDDQNDLALRRGSDDRIHGEDQPQQHIARERHSHELRRAARNHRDDRSADAVERAGDERRHRREVNVKRREPDDHHERRQHERQTDERRAEHSAARPTEVDRELRGERPGRQLREREAAFVFVEREPATIVDEVALHRAGERDRTAEARGAEVQEVSNEPR